MVVARDVGDGWRLLLLRAYRNWDCPKGLVEPGESPLDAAIREAREEAGIDDLEFRWGTDYHETPPYSGGKIARYYVAATRIATPVLGVAPHLGRPEHHEYRWVDLAEALRLTVPRIQSALTWAGAKIMAQYRIV